MIEINDVEYLRGLTRMDIRKKERGLAKHVLRPGQSDEDFREFRVQLESQLEWRRGVLERLTALRKDLKSRPGT